MVWDLYSFEDLEVKDRLLDLSVNDKGICRTAPATPGLFIILIMICKIQNLFKLILFLKINIFFSFCFGL